MHGEWVQIWVEIARQTLPLFWRGWHAPPFFRRHGPSGESQVGELVYLLQLVQFSSTLSAGCMHVEAECSG